LAAAALIALPAGANAQSSWFTPTAPAYPGFYMGAEGAANRLLNNNSYVMDTGWAVGGKVATTSSVRASRWKVCTIPTQAGRSWPFPRAMHVSGRIEQISVMANRLYDFFHGATVTPYIGAGAGVAFVDANIQGCKTCLTMFAYQGILGLGFNATPALRIGVEGRRPRFQSLMDFAPPAAGGPMFARHPSRSEGGHALRFQIGNGLA
jgi:OmpA-OmpF porin, OOP family